MSQDVITQGTAAQRRIKAALAQLLEEKDLQALTVSDIARRAKVNRGTFYLHYTDKFDLMQSLANATLADLSEIIQQPDHASTTPGSEVIPYDTIVRLLTYLREDIDFVRALLGPNGMPSLADDFKTLVVNDLRKRLATAPPPKDPQQVLAPAVVEAPREYLDEILMSSAVSAILLWIRRGAQEPPEQIADLIAAARSLSPVDLLRLAVSADQRP